MKPQGILPDDLHDPEFVRQCEDHERQQEADRKLEEAAAQRAAEIEHTCDSVDKTFSMALRNEMAAENKVARISRATQRDFAAFQKCCAPRVGQRTPGYPMTMAPGGPILLRRS